ncbi:hypothetical protein ASPCAL04310 [Aspergillus calidoustus]|uniref:Uncharacterized protein n=1 Tax=Aspergillus calidoustus TaxID=454130 RepID=A0A0U5FUE7_ASPCI|nr:hypothetical protein ASPCAL04310 [Aspergillus calidoustus]
MLCNFRPCGWCLVTQCVMRKWRPLSFCSLPPTSLLHLYPLRHRSSSINKTSTMQHKKPTSLGDLPCELLLKVNDHLSEPDQNALARTNREIYGCINYILYRDNIRHGNASALRWAVTNNMESTVHICLEQGATIDPPSLPAEEEEWMVRSRPCFGDLPLISIAAAKGYDGILELFLDKGADPNVFVPGAGTPLSLAIEGRRTSTFRLLLSHNKIDAHSRVAYTDLSPMYYAWRQDL